ncbi:MAG: ABC transporter ATP-binding protein [Pedobacter sp.]
MLQFDKFQKSYGNNPVLDVADLTINPGIYWLKGRNGSGKSTLLKSIGGFLFYKGEILIDNISLKKQGVRYRQKVNFADAEPVFPEFLTGWEMIRMFKQAKGGSIDQEHHLIESMNMQGYLSNSLGTYSSGMLKKLSLVLAFLGDPKLILLDEPLITIDIESLKVLYEWVITKHKKHNISFILSSHQPVDSATLVGLQEISIVGKTLKLDF